MAKVMVFIDGSWLYVNAPRLASAAGRTNFVVDYGKLPHILCDTLSELLGRRSLDLVRTHLFGSYADNHDPLDDHLVQKRWHFYDLLREKHHYEVEVFPINYAGRRIRKADRPPEDDFEAKEKCVDIALATSMLYYAAMPSAYDIAIAVLGDRDFAPVLQHVRRLGKRVAIASIRGTCAEELYDPVDKARVKDFDLIWIDDLLEPLQLRLEVHRLACASQFHVGERTVETTYKPLPGQSFFCDACRSENERRRASASPDTVEVNAVEAIGETIHATITAMKQNANGYYGFLKSKAGTPYYFNPTQLVPPLQWSELFEGQELQAQVDRLPTTTSAGSVFHVRLPNQDDGFASGLEGQS